MDGWTRNLFSDTIDGARFIFDAAGWSLIPAVIEIHSTAHTYKSCNSADRNVDTMGSLQGSSAEGIKTAFSIGMLKKVCLLETEPMNIIAQIHYNEYRNGDDQKQLNQIISRIAVGIFQKFHALIAPLDRISAS
ncbi:MAG: hypothetical protein ACLS48_01885 [[Eubacterium] siraeum]